MKKWSKYTRRTIALLLAVTFVLTTAIGGTMAWRGATQDAVNVVSATQPWLDDLPDGDLVIEKQVVNLEGELTPELLERAFQFTVDFFDELDEYDEPIHAAGDFAFFIYPYEGDAPVMQTIQSGGTFDLRHGERAIFPNLQGGLQYRITEDVPSDFDVSTVGDQGVIGIGDNHAVFTNTYNPAEPPPADTSLIVRKELTGDVPEDQQDAYFYFVVSIPAFGGYPNREWRFSIQAGSEWQLDNLPIGALVMVREVNMPDGFVLYNVTNGFVSLTEETIISTFTNRFVERDCCDCEPGGGCDCGEIPGGCDCGEPGNCDCGEPGGCDCGEPGGCDCGEPGNCDCGEPGNCDCAPCDCDPCDCGIGGGCDCEPGSGCDCEPGNCDCEPGACDCPPIVPAPAVTIAKSASPMSVVTGSTIQYTLRVENTGNAVLTGLVVTDTLPPELQNPRNPSLPIGANGGFVGQTLTVTLGELAIGQAVTITFDVTATAPTGTAADIQVTNTAHVTYPNNPDIGGDSSVTVTIRPPGGGGGPGPGPGPDPDPDPDPSPGPDPSPFSPYHNSYLIGRPSGNIYPHDNILRSEVAAVFFRLLSDETRIAQWSQTNQFPDVNSPQWFNNEVSTMTNMGIIRGMPNGTFAPNQAITRAEVAAIVARFFDETGTDGMAFTDISGHWAEDYINQLAHLGWVQGPGDGTFRPNQLITRAEFAAIINRMLDRVPDSLDALLDGRTHWPDKTDTNAWFYLYMQEATHSTEFQRLPNGNLRWTTILDHIDWSIFSRPNARPDDIMVSRGR